MESSKLQVVDIEWPSGVSDGPAFCPLCGIRTFNEHEDPEPCAHVQLIFFEDPLYMSEDFKKRADQYESEHGESVFDIEGEFANGIAQLGYGENCVVMSVSSSGFCCGPMSCTAFYLFDFSVIPAEWRAED